MYDNVNLSQSVLHCKSDVVVVIVCRNRIFLSNGIHAPAVQIVNGLRFFRVEATLASYNLWSLDINLAVRWQICRIPSINVCRLVRKSEFVGIPHVVVAGEFRYVLPFAFHLFGHDFDGQRKRNIVGVDRQGISSFLVGRSIVFNASRVAFCNV